jgi:hypothetical protein
MIAFIHCRKIRTVTVTQGPGYHSRYSDVLNDRSSIPNRVKGFSLRGAQIVSGAHPGALSPGVNRFGRESDHSDLVPWSRMMEINPHSPIRLHGVVFQLLSTGTTLIQLIPSLYMETVSYAL